MDWWAQIPRIQISSSMVGNCDRDGFHSTQGSKDWNIASSNLFQIFRVNSIGDKYATFESYLNSIRRRRSREMDEWMWMESCHLISPETELGFIEFPKERLICHTKFATILKLRLLHSTRFLIILRRRKRNWNFLNYNFGSYWICSAYSKVAVSSF